MTHTERPLTITRQPGADGPVVLRVGGELDHHTAHRLREVLASVPFGADGVVVDLSDLEYCDSTGLTVFITAYHRAADEGSALGLAGLPPDLERIFRISGLDQVIPLYPTPEHAPGGPRGRIATEGAPSPAAGL